MAKTNQITMRILNEVMRWLATSLSYRYMEPTFMAGLEFFGFINKVEIKPKMNDPRPNPPIISPDTSPFELGKWSHPTLSGIV